MQLKEAYDVLINAESRELYDFKRDVYGVIPCEFLPRNHSPPFYL